MLKECSVFLSVITLFVVVSSDADPKVAATSLSVLGFSTLPAALHKDVVTEIRRSIQRFRREHPESILIEALNPEGDVSPLGIPDALSHPQLRHAVRKLLKNLALHSVFRAYFGGSGYRLLNHSDIGINRRTEKFHTDARSEWFDNLQAEASRDASFRILKVSLYLQDHRTSDACLSVVPGSHQVGTLSNSGYISLHTALGDIVLFDQRLIHSGAAYTSSTTDRLYVSFAVGAKNVFSDLHERANILRQDKQKIQAKKEWIDHVKRMMRAKQLFQQPVNPYWLNTCDGQYCCRMGSRNSRSQRLPSDAHTLSRIAHRYKSITNKVETSTLQVKHAHSEFYGPLLVRDVLEVGSGLGGSALMWRDFFPAATVWSLDTSAKQLRLEAYDTRRVRFLEADGTNVGALSRLMPNASFDIIVESAAKDRVGKLQILNSHAQLVRPGGMLILEDVLSSSDAAFIVAGFRGDQNRLSVVDRTFCRPAHCSERLILYLAHERRRVHAEASDA
eukprot:TRINITY_DN16679_c0_g1_i2.p1 TRINITY_DN16679_c0_g1~~TRINITY_DN16679_c0_g1_i2.p1  ORF type:complete len:504 (-),score=59.78 TRINITY_DN16679_c0_g1_i2:151-1662(-)